MKEEIKQKTSWEDEFDKFVEKGYKDNFGLSSTNRLNWGCEECGGQDAENDIKNFISQALEKRDEEIKQKVEDVYLRIKRRKVDKLPIRPYGIKNSSYKHHNGIYKNGGNTFKQISVLLLRELISTLTTK